MRGPLLTLLVIQLLCTGSAYGKAEYQQVTVDDPYIEMHTGPGKGYPIFHVVDRGDSIEVIKRRTDWFLIRTVAGKEGWASRAQMELTLQPSGERTEIKDTTIDFGLDDLGLRLQLANGVVCIRERRRHPKDQAPGDDPAF